MEIMLPQRMNVRKIEQENYRTKTIVLDNSWNAYPGQFAMVWLPRFDEKPFSLVNSDPLTLMVTDVGPFSHLIHQLQVGDSLWLRGPFGQGYEITPATKKPVLIGGGYGVAPLFWLAQEQRSSVEAIHVIIGARTAADVLYAEHFDELPKGPASLAPVTLHVTTEDGTRGTRGLVTDALQLLIETSQADSIYACGPHGMLAALQKVGAMHNIPTQLSWEAYMRCGVGICGACEHEGKVLCMDGPVLRTGNRIGA